MSVAGEPRKKIGIRINAFSLFATTKKEINLVALIIFDHSTDKNLFCRNTLEFLFKIRFRSVLFRFGNQNHAILSADLK